MAFSDEPNTAPEYGSLKTLTVLTFIGSGLSIVFSLFTPMITSFMKKTMEAAVTSGKELSTKELEKIEEGRKAIALAESNMIPIMIVGIVAAVACIIGAMMMRKLKKDGFYIYTAGEILPLIVGFILMGNAQYTSVWSYLFGIGLPVIFIILYATNLKHLK